MMTAVLAGAVGAAAVASEANWVTVAYHDHSQVDLSCGAGAICEVELDRGESLNGGQFVGEQENGQELWQHSSFIEGVPTDRGTQMRPHLTFVPASAGLSAQAVVSTDKHLYRFLLRSVDSQQPTYVRMVYPEPPRPPVHPKPPVRFAAFVHHPAPLPMDPLSQMNRACQAMPKGEQYGSDPQPAEWRPVRVCHSSDRTFIQLAGSDTVPTDVPVPREVTDKGDVNLVWAYDSRSRIYGVDLVPNEIVLTLGSGKHQMRLRIQRQRPLAPAVAARGR